MCARNCGRRWHERFGWHCVAPERHAASEADRWVQRTHEEVNTMKSNWRTKFKPAQVLLAAGTAFSGMAHAVQDLPGGPTVRQLNMPVGVTKIAQEQHFLHTVMMILC